MAFSCLGGPVRSLMPLLLMLRVACLDESVIYNINTHIGCWTGFWRPNTLPWKADPAVSGGARVLVVCFAEAVTCISGHMLPFTNQDHRLMIQTCEVRRTPGGLPLARRCLL